MNVYDYRTYPSPVPCTGLSAAILLLLSGDILGASGLVSSSILTPRKTLTDPSITWKLVFLSSFLLCSNLALGKYFAIDTRLGNDTSIPVVSIYGYLVGGFFVGFGTKLGNGCPTGHGICGMARLSKRSFSAVMTFMATAIAMACVTAPDNKTLSKATSFLRTDDEPPVLFNQGLGLGVTVAVVLPTIISLLSLSRQYRNRNDGRATMKSNYSTFDGPKKAKSSPEPKTKHDENNKDEDKAVGDASAQQPSIEDDEAQRDHIRKLAPAAFVGSIFAVGLAVSGMVLPSKVLGFLNMYTLFVTNSYDPTLACVMGGGLVVSFISYQYIEQYRYFTFFTTKPMTCPIVSSKFNVTSNTIIDYQLIGGAMCFGIGWAIAGLCPGPAIFLAATGTFPVIFAWWPAFMIGNVQIGRAHV